MQGSEDRAVQVEKTADQRPDEGMNLMTEWKKDIQWRPTTVIHNEIIQIFA